MLSAICSEQNTMETPRKIRDEPLDADFSPLSLHESDLTFIEISCFDCLSE